jgi:hypothetical protein
MEIPLNAQVECTEGDCVGSVHVLINPVIDQFIVGHNGRYIYLKERVLGFEERITEARQSYCLCEAEVIYT